MAEVARDEALFNNSRTLSIVNFILGLWLIVSPYILNYGTAQARWEQTVGGVIIAIMAAIRYYIPEARWSSWVNALVALWLVIAPFVSGYQTGVAYWNEIISGILVGAVALWNAGLSPTGLSTRGHAA